MITASEMAALEKKSERQGVSCLTLMENAGKGIADIVKKKFPAGKRILVLAYHGNNGGDGFVAARYLSEYKVDVWFLGDEKKLKNEARDNFRKLSKLLSKANLGDYDILIDALLGTGAKGGLREPLQSLAKEWNKATGYKIAVDIPTGLDPDTGEKHEFFEPDLIITFHDIKPGLIKFMDKTVVVNIGICVP